jgi:hypothetical protein
VVIVIEVVDRGHRPLLVALSGVSPVDCQRQTSQMRTSGQRR